MESGNSISVLVVEDHKLLRLCIRTTLDHDKCLSVVGEAANGIEAVERASTLHPDVIVMDINMPLMDGIESSRHIKELNPRTKIIMLTSINNDEMIRSALSSGASGYCLKDIDSDRLCEAIKTVHRGDMWLDSGIAKQVMRLCHDAEAPTSMVSTAPALSEREKRLLLSLTGEGSTSNIAEHLEISSTAARHQLINLLKKVGRTNDSIAGPPRKSVHDTVRQQATALDARYELLSVIGHGGTSIVYQARDMTINKLVAIKLIDPITAGECFSLRFTLEARVTSRLDHPNIIRVHDFGTTSDGRQYLVMDFIDGPSLEDVLKRTGKVDEREAVIIFKQVASALAHAHEQGVIHRDVKPGNLLLEEQGNSITAKLVDFGIASLINREQKITQDGQIIGSPLYMSPEQCRGHKIDPRTDIYSLGCVMYETICGYAPIHGDTTFDTMTMHIHEAPTAPDPTLCSPAMQVILSRCLQKAPEERISSANELMDLLERLE